MGEQKPAAISRDIQWLLKVMLNHWNDVFASVLTKTERTLMHEALDVRNRWAHQGTFSPDDAYRALDTAERLLRAVNETEQASRIETAEGRLSFGNIQRASTGEFLLMFSS